MTSSSRTAVLLLCTCLLPWTMAIDCRRFVFAPLCRGISAKRAVPQETNTSLRDRDSVSLSEAEMRTPEVTAEEDWSFPPKVADADEELRAANDHLMLYLLAQVPSLKAKTKGRLRAPLTSSQED